MSATKEEVNGPILCAVCVEPVGKGGYQYDITDTKKGRRYKLYAFVHAGNCDDAFKVSLDNPDIALESP